MYYNHQDNPAVVMLEEYSQRIRLSVQARYRLLTLTPQDYLLQLNHYLLL